MKVRRGAQLAPARVRVPQDVRNALARVVDECGLMGACAVLECSRDTLDDAMCEGGILLPKMLEKLVLALRSGSWLAAERRQA